MMGSCHNKRTLLWRGLKSSISSPHLSLFQNQIMRCQFLSPFSFEPFCGYSKNDAWKSPSCQPLLMAMLVTTARALPFSIAGWDDSSSLHHENHRALWCLCPMHHPFGNHESLLWREFNPLVL